MYGSTDAAIIFGRGLFGEPKKQATVGLNRQGTKMRGWVERHGTRLIGIKADLTNDVGPAKVGGKNFNIKAVPATKGDGPEDDAILALAEFENDLKLNWTGQGSCTLCAGSLDPLDEIEVKEVLGASYFEGDMDSHARSIARISAADYLPYYYGRLDDWSLLNTEDALKSLWSSAQELAWGRKNDLRQRGELLPLIER